MATRPARLLLEQGCYLLLEQGGYLLLDGYPDVDVPDAGGTKLGNTLFRWPDRRPETVDDEFDLIVALVAADAI